MPVSMLRERRQSFVELYSYDGTGASNYGTAGYLGHGYFITVKHGVIALGESRRARKITSVKIMLQRPRAGRAHRRRGRRAGRGRSRRLGDPQGERGGRPAAARTSTSPIGFDFADPIFRLGNDYSKGIILSTGYVGQRTSNNLVTCLTDGHPGVSGGGVLNRRRRARRHPDRPDAGGLPLLVHPAAARRDVPEGLVPELIPGRI